MDPCRSTSIVPFSNMHWHQWMNGRKVSCASAAVRCVPLVGFINLFLCSQCQGQIFFNITFKDQIFFQLTVGAKFFFLPIPGPDYFFKQKLTGPPQSLK